MTDVESIASEYFRDCVSGVAPGMKGKVMFLLKKTEKMDVEEKVRYILYDWFLAQMSDEYRKTTNPIAKISLGNLLSDGRSGYWEIHSDDVIRVWNEAYEKFMTKKQ